MAYQTTLREKVALVGIGLHSGRRAALLLLPAPVDHGIVFVRDDVPGSPELRPCPEHLVDTTLATTLGVTHNGQKITVATVEHLLAAFQGLGVDNVRVLVDGPEVPILDGSAQEVVTRLLAHGLEAQDAHRKKLVIRREVRVRDGHKEAKIAPGPGLKITCSVDFDHPLIGPKPYTFEVDGTQFVRELAPARTFGFLRDVEALKARGLALGGSLDNAIVIDDFQVLNPEGLRFSDEFVRHKALDALGDIALLGLPVQGKLTLTCSGHALNAALVRKVLEDPRNFEVRVPKQAARADSVDAACRLELFGAAKGMA